MQDYIATIGDNGVCAIAAKDTVEVIRGAVDFEGRDEIITVTPNQRINTAIIKNGIVAVLT